MKPDGKVEEAAPEIVFLRVSLAPVIPHLLPFPLILKALQSVGQCPEAFHVS